MLRLSLKAKAKVATVMIATTSVLTLGSSALTQHASADPGAASARNAVGSDTIQDVMNALSGADPYPANSATHYFGPVIHSTSASGSVTINSWDAIPNGGSATAPGCITTTYGGVSFDRPNGSGNGIRALSHAVDPTGNTTWWAGEPTVGGGPTNNPTTSCTGATATTKGVDVSAQINYARSSAGPTHSGLADPRGVASQLLYIPFGGDAVGFAYFDHNTGTIATLSSSQLQQLYNNLGPTPGRITVGADTVHACITQQGSGTTKFWEKALGVTDAQAQASSAASGCTANPSLLEENGGNAFNTYASTLGANNDAVVDFSAGSWISQANPNTALDRSGTARANHVDLGAIDDSATGGPNLGKPYIVSGTLLAPNPTFYASTTYGRNVFVVVPTLKILGGLSVKDKALIDLFSGAGSAICTASAQTLVNQFGFQSIGTCGALTTTGNFYDTAGGTQTA